MVWDTCLCLEVLNEKEVIYLSFFSINGIMLLYNYFCFMHSYIYDYQKV